MKTAENQMKRKAFYVGASGHMTYEGTRTQPGHVGNRAGTKLSRKASDERASRYRGGVVSKSYENIASAVEVLAKEASESRAGEQK